MTMIKNYKKYLDKEIIRKAEVADMIGCHINSVNNYVKRQGLPIRREKGMHPYFLASQVLDWIKQGK
jgi:phage terminase Nu1 subunit (DNA packaging protein)